MILGFITNFGDLAVLIPLVAILCLWLLAAHRPGIALWWIAAFCLCSGGTAILKMYFYVCPLVASDLHSPSGHTSLSTLVYGAITVIAAAEATVAWRRRLIGAAGTIFVVSIGLSRVVVQAHTIIEVALGFAIGLAALALFAYAYRRSAPVGYRLWLLLVVFAPTMLLLNGDELRAEELLHRLAVYLNVARIGCA